MPFFDTPLMKIELLTSSEKSISKTISNINIEMPQLFSACGITFRDIAKAVYQFDIEGSCNYSKL
jgi:hypothetical protein